MAPETNPDTKEADKRATRVLEKALEVFATKDVGFMQRWDTRPVENVARPSVTHTEPAVLWWYPITVIGQTWKVIVLRHDGESFSAARYGILDEIHSVHQVVTISELIAFMKKPPKRLLITLDGLLMAAKDARARLSTTGRSLDAV